MGPGASPTRTRRPPRRLPAACGLGRLRRTVAACRLPSESHVRRRAAGLQGRTPTCDAARWSASTATRVAGPTAGTSTPTVACRLSMASPCRGRRRGAYATTGRTAGGRTAIGGTPTAEPSNLLRGGPRPRGGSGAGPPQGRRQRAARGRRCHARLRGRKSGRAGAGRTAPARIAPSTTRR